MVVVPRRDELDHQFTRDEDVPSLREIFSVEKYWG
jgi:hypothetical protein